MLSDIDFTHIREMRGDELKTGKIFMAIILLLLITAGCDSRGNSFGVKTHLGPSEIFTEKELRDGVSSVKEAFQSFTGSSLLEIIYDESSVAKKSERFRLPGTRKPLDKENILIFESKFKTGVSGVEKHLKPETVYTNWYWVLTRKSPGDKWVVSDWGH